MTKYIPNTKIIHNPRCDELAPEVQKELNKIGTLIPLCRGKSKGFRVEYHNPEFSAKEKIEEVLRNRGISVIKSTEYISPDKSYLNIHVIRIPRKTETQQMSLF